MSILYNYILPFLTRNQRKPAHLSDMKITEDHWLEEVRRSPIEGGSVMNVRRFLIIHNTAGWSGASSIEGWRASGKGVCAHVVIERDGTIIQCRPFNRTCGHAGVSQWRAPGSNAVFHNLNSCSIGIELANAADMARNPDVYPQYLMGELAGKPVPRHPDRHKHARAGSPVVKWEVYSHAQIAACEDVSRALVERYNLDDVVGHEDVSRGRKVDPGPAFPMQVLRNACGFTKLL